MLVGTFALLTLAQWAYAACLPSFLWPDLEPLPRSSLLPILALLITLNGFCQGVGQPPTYELGGGVLYFLCSHGSE